MDTRDTERERSEREHHVVGPPRVGNAHLAVALGMSACALGLRTMFTTAAGLITTLGKALHENRLEERLKLLTQPKLLIIDEIGYIPIDRQGANLFFHLISRRYERGSILVTSNQNLGAWGESSATRSSRARSPTGCRITRRRSASRATRTA